MLSFSRSSRLAKKQDFDFVFAKPRKVSRLGWRVFYRQNELGFARLGIMIGKQAVKRAVDRNRFRRLIRESFRAHQDHLKGADIVIMVKSECLSLDNQTLRVDIGHLWSSIKV